MFRFFTAHRNFSRGALLVLALGMIAFVVHEIFGEHGYLALRRQRQEYEALQQQVQTLQKGNQELEQQIEGLKSDPKAIEKLAREQMRMARPGEIIYVLPEKKPDTSKPASPPSPPAKSKG